MKGQEGITLVSLAVYVLVMIIVLTTIGMIINQFYENTDKINADTEEIIEFNKFNTYFLKEVKLKNNAVDTITDNYILFKSGNTFSLSNNSLYYNDREICKDVQEFTVLKGKDGDEIDETVIYIKISFSNFTKSMNYKIEEIY